MEHILFGRFWQPILSAVDHAYAQRLADVLGTDVIAPDFNLRVGKRHRVVMDGDGDWYRFQPRPEVSADYTLDVHEDGRAMLTDPYDPDSEAVWPRQRQLAVLDQIIAHAQRHVDEV